jgi:hypothetical protein
LSHAGQEQLIKNLVVAFGYYQFAAKPIKRVTAGEQHKQLEKIEETTRKLLRLLNIDLISGVRKDCLPTAWLEQAGIDFKGRDASTVNTELAEAHGEVTNSIIALRKLHERAKLAAEAAATKVDPRRGGSRHPPGAKGQLIRNAIVIYRHMRGHYPESGNKPGIGEPMLKFVRAVGELFGVGISNGAIEEAWRPRESNSK